MDIKYILERIKITEDINILNKISKYTSIKSVKDLNTFDYKELIMDINSYENYFRESVGSRYLTANAIRRKL